MTIGSLKTALIGLFVVIALGLIVYMLLFLHPSVGDNANILRVRFTDIDKVNIGTRVTFAGRPVGEVISIQEIPNARTERINRNGDVYIYELVLKVDSAVEVFNTDEILLRTSGLLGERNIEINPQPLLANQKLILVNNEVLYAEQTGSVETTLKQFNEISKKFGTILDDVHHTMEEITKNAIVSKLASSIQNVVEITSSLNQPEKLNHLVENLWLLTDRAKHSWENIDRSLSNLYSFTERLNQTLLTFDQGVEGFKSTAQYAKILAEKASHGEGTLGQLFVGNELYLRLKSILHKGETTMNDINHYGILFHQDKRWQRLQGQRLRLLEKLSCPAAFARYFDEKMNKISSSLFCISMLLNETECHSQPLIYSTEFTAHFGELLKGVENMEETLQLYNEQIISQEQEN